MQLNKTLNKIFKIIETVLRTWKTNLSKKYTGNIILLFSSLVKLYVHSPDKPLRDC